MKKQVLGSSFRAKILLGILLFCLNPIAFAQLTSTIDKTKVQIGEPFTLTIRLETDQTSNLEPNFKPLQKDFRIEATESEVNLNVINGQIRSISEWKLLMTAKQKGVLIIPSLSVGKEKTLANKIEVTEGAVPSSVRPMEEMKSSSSPQKSSQGDQKEIKLMVDLSNTSPYVNQQIIYTVKLYNSSRLLDANYQPPQVEDSLFVPLGTGRRYQENENGRIYTVEEQQFALFPQKSGFLKIQPPSFNALIYDLSPRRVTAFGQPLTLDVKEIPKEYQSKNWLPAKEVTLTENYDKNTSSLTQGSTLVRTVEVEAVAVPAQLLPPLDFGKSDQFSVYPEKPIENNQLKQQNLVGRASIKATYLLNKSGKITIPELTLPWFNTITGKGELASLPGFTINVLPATVPNSINEKPKVLEKPELFKPAPESKKTMAPIQRVEKLQSKLAWWLVVGFAFAWLLTLLAWGLQYNRKRQKSQSKAQVLNELRQACLNNKPKEARNGLLKWGRLQWPESDFLNLFDLGQRITEPELKDEINKLAQRLYQNTRQNWQGSALWQAIVNYKPNTARKEKSNPLPHLNRI